MAQRKYKKRNGGFTLVETLLVVAIVIVLFALSVAGVGRLRSRLKITELDNAAREIYLAAQNRAVLLSNRGALSPLVVRPDGSNALEQSEEAVCYYFVANDDPALEQLLPDGTIDPALTDGTFYVVYEPVSGSVTDVFYMEQPHASLPGGMAFGEYYPNADLDQEVRRTSTPMVGWYGGEPSEAGDAINLRAPLIEIYNDDTLRAAVKWWVPALLASQENDVKLKLTLTCSDGTGRTIELTDPERHLVHTRQYDSSNSVHRDEFLLDSLANGQRFKDLLGLSEAEADRVLGGEFTVTAEVYFDGAASLRVNPGAASKTDNSLFAAQTGSGNTAYIACMRHLQNLDPATSGVSPAITAAVQTADISNPVVPAKYPQPVSGAASPYRFIPINNKNLTCYDGQEKEIRSLLVQTSGDAGLFGSFGGALTRSSLTGVRLVNARVQGGKNAAGSSELAGPFAGTLCAAIDNADVSDCQVFWRSTDPGQSDMTDLLGSAGEDYAIAGTAYMVSGYVAGGMFGHAKNTAIHASSASTTVSGAGVAGGLVGEGGTGLNAFSSYADCYLASRQAGGLVGKLQGNSCAFENVYSAGFISNASGAKAAGLIGGSGGTDIRVSRSYAAMQYENTDSVKAVAENGLLSDNVYYLSVTGGQTVNNAVSVDTAELIKMAEDNTIPGFARQTDAQTCAYNLQEEMALTRYPYPAVEGLTHYGDWPDMLRVDSLVYWERYADGADVGICGGNVNRLSNDKGAVTDDGYAILLPEDAFIRPTSEVVIRYMATPVGGGETLTAERTYTLEITDSFSQGGKTYYLAKLPRTLVNPDTASGSFYWELQADIAIDGSPASSHTFYYSPHFAATALDGTSGAVPEPPANISIRSARQLYMLSRFSEYYNNAASSYTFLQRLDIDYDRYLGTFDGTEEQSQTLSSQSPIGQSEPFSEVYNGGYHTVENLPLSAGDGSAYAGLFGYNTGSINNLFYEGGTYAYGSADQRRDAHLSLSVAAYGGEKYVGQFCGYNSGSIYNCSVSNIALGVNASSSATVYMGGMVGYNDGLVANCSAVTDGLALESDGSAAWLGGFVGGNGAGSVVDSCYAVGMLDERGSGGSLHLAGFAAASQGLVQNSYCAASLTLSGGQAPPPFCPDRANTPNCYYLDQGYFDFRYGPDQPAPAAFTAKYADDGDSQSMTWEQFTDATDRGLLSRLGSEFSFGGTPGDPYPFPEVVQIDAAGTKAHHGIYVEKLDMDELGVFYWEHETGGSEGYHVSAVSLTLKGDTGEIIFARELSDLCTDHADGGVIDQYGYGYYCTGDGIAPVIEADGKNGATVFDSGAENTQAEEALKHLLHYTGAEGSFKAYTTADSVYDPHTAPSTYIADSSACTRWAFVNDRAPAHPYYFDIAPFFADAFCCAEPIDGVTEHLGLPGTAERPYAVRSVQQLQLINWNSADKNAAGGIAKDGANAAAFPYLNSAANGTVRYWQQSHDLCGLNGAAAFAPIAAIYAQGPEEQAEILYGWFGGSYDGGGYSIQEVNIASDASCVGLFGAAYNATLQNIVLYSPSGSAAVTRVGDSSETASWYAIGGLAGLAAANDPTAYPIENCAVAGYDILDRSAFSGTGGAGVGGLVGLGGTRLSRCAAAADIDVDVQYHDSGRTVRIGGLAGSCQQSIDSCYTGGTITVSDGSLQPSADGATRVRTGGIVGGTYMKALAVQGDTDGDGVNDTVPVDPCENTVSNCYTYTVLPANVDTAGGNNRQYAIGGGADETAENGQGQWRISAVNCYYLNTLTLPAAGQSSFDADDTYQDITGLTYDQLAGRMPVIGADTPDVAEDDAYICDVLDLGAGGPFRPVTTQTLTGIANGQYSYPITPSLQGLNYPFPAVLVMPGQEDIIGGDGTACVHYGDWPPGGLERKSSDPVHVDLFTDFHETETDDSGAVTAQAGVYRDELVWVSQLLADLSGSPTGGRFLLKGADRATGVVDTAVCEASFLPDGAPLGPDEWDTAADGPSPAHFARLRIAPKGQGTDTVTVQYADDAGNVLAELDIPVEVTAELRLAPRDTASPEAIEETADGREAMPETVYAPSEDPITVFAGCESQLDLYPFNADGEAIDTTTSLWEKIGPTLTASAFRSDAAFIAAAQAQAPCQDAAMTLDLQGVAPTVAGQLTDLTFDYSFQYGEITMTGAALIPCQVRQLASQAENLFFFADETGMGGGQSYTADKIRFFVDDPASGEGAQTDITGQVTGANITGAAGAGTGENLSQSAVQVVYTQTDSGAGGVGVSPIAPGEERMTVDVSFVYGQCRHTATVYPMAYVYGFDKTALQLTGKNIYMDPTGSCVIISGGSDVISVTNHVEPGWEVTWAWADEAAADHFSLTPGADDPGHSATVTRISVPDTTDETFELTATVQVTDDQGMPIATLRGVISIATGDGRPLPSPEQTSEGEPIVDAGPDAAEPTVSPEPSPVVSPEASPETSPDASAAPTESPAFSPEPAPEQTPEPSPETSPEASSEPGASPEISPEASAVPTESPAFSPEPSPEDTPTPVEPDPVPVPDGTPTESPAYSPEPAPAQTPAPTDAAEAVG